MLTIVASTNATAAPSDAIASTVRGDGPRRRAGGAASTSASAAAEVSLEWGIPLAPPDMPDERLDVVPDHCLRTSARAEKHAWPLAVPITGWVAAPAAGLNAAAGEVVVLRGYPTGDKALVPAPRARGRCLHAITAASRVAVRAAAFGLCECQADVEPKTAV